MAESDIAILRATLTAAMMSPNTKDESDAASAALARIERIVADALVAETWRRSERRAYVRAHAPTLLATMLPAGRDFDSMESRGWRERAIETAGRLFDETEAPGG